MIDTTQYPIQIRANARLVDAGRKKLEACPPTQQIQICVVLIIDYNWKLEQIPTDIVDDVKRELSMIE